MILTDLLHSRFWSKVALPNAEGCMLWTDVPASGGYGRFRIGSRKVLAHRLSLILALGPPPEADMEAAHGCRNRLCVAPDHLRWATRTANQRDRHRDGTDARGDRHPQRKLSSSDVRDIRQALTSGMSQYEAARQWDVTRTHIYRIAHRLNWRYSE